MECQNGLEKSANLLRIADVKQNRALATGSRQRTMEELLKGRPYQEGTRI